MSIDYQGTAVATDSLEILEVSRDRGEGLDGHFRVMGTERKLEIVGWTLAEEGTVREVVVVAEGTQVAAVPLTIERPDVAEKYPDRPDGARCGFRIELAGEGDGHSLLELFAVLEDETREPLGRILCHSRS
ncbi:MAG: hypothetical protein JST53_03425 [Actinobacteria bacterium]|nr:hypothetical protein [Actinomycetota bacterium]